jgi:hypothetical protein
MLVCRQCDVHLNAAIVIYAIRGTSLKEGTGSQDQEALS